MHVDLRLCGPKINFWWEFGRNRFNGLDARVGVGRTARRTYINTSVLVNVVFIKRGISNSIVLFVVVGHTNYSLSQLCASTKRIF